jgi:four helix bundle protein
VSAFLSVGNFRDLVVYQRAAGLSDEIRACVRAWPPADAYGVGAQVTRAADSVAANIAEAAGRWSAPDQARLYVIARGSVTEAENWLARAEARDLPVPENAADRMSEVGRMLNGLIRAARTRKSPN